MSSSSDSIFGITTMNLAIPPGATNAVLISPGAYIRASLVKYFSGGSISIFGANSNAFGGSAAWTGTSLVAGFSQAYMLATTEILSIGGPVQYYLAATGSTAVASILQGMSQNQQSMS